MLWNLGMEWLMIAVAIVAILSFVVALALDAVVKEEGFGATGNAVIITVGFFFAIFTLNTLGHRMVSLNHAVSTGLFGAFICFSVLMVVKGVLKRIL